MCKGRRGMNSLSVTVAEVDLILFYKMVPGIYLEKRDHVKLLYIFLNFLVKSGY